MKRRQPEHVHWPRSTPEPREKKKKADGRFAGYQRQGFHSEKCTLYKRRGSVPKCVFVASYLARKPIRGPFKIVNEEKKNNHDILVRTIVHHNQGPAKQPLSLPAKKKITEKAKES